ncbi:MAG TPA: tetratricopeptide repeat protein [Vicinamibacterales bacterium]|nr:tetratricopeptide repeat protein [Vicinamibacterales bacterium]
MTSIPRRIGAFGIGVALLMVMSGELSAQSLSLVVPPAGAARDAFQALEEGRYKDADAAFARALAAAPEDPALLLGAGLAARRLSHAARARELLTRALQIDPALTPASQLLGTMLYESGDLEGAIRVYDAALVRAPDQVRMAARVGEWRQEAALHEGFRRTLGGHFTVLFEGPAEEEAAAAAVDILESAYDSIGGLLQAFPAEPITVVLYTQQQFRDITRTPGWSGGLFDGRIRLPVRGGLADRREFERVLTHEYVHALVHSVAAGGVPAWLNEGLAAALETGGADRARKAIARGTVVPLRSLERSFASLPDSAVTGAYAGSALAVLDILDRVGPSRLMGLLADLGAGADFDRAFTSWVQMPFADFQREWAEKIQTIRSTR